MMFSLSSDITDYSIYACMIYRKRPIAILPVSPLRAFLFPKIFFSIKQSYNTLLFHIPYSIFTVSSSPGLRHHQSILKPIITVLPTFRKVGNPANYTICNGHYTTIQ